jgi:hypothetical protein
LFGFNLGRVAVLALRQQRLAEQAVRGRAVGIEPQRLARALLGRGRVAGDQEVRQQLVHQRVLRLRLGHASQRLDGHQRPRRLLLDLRQQPHGLLVRRLVFEDLLEQLLPLVPPPGLKRAHGVVDRFVGVHFPDIVAHLREVRKRRSRAHLLLSPRS